MRLWIVCALLCSLACVFCVPGFADGTHLTVWPTVSNIVYDPVNELPSATGGTITVLPGSSLAAGSYVILESFPNYDVGNGGGNHTLVKLAAVLGAAGATGGHWTSVPYTGGASYPSTSPIPSVTGPLTGVMIGDSISAFTSSLLQTSLQAVFPNAAVSVSNVAVPGSMLTEWGKGGQYYSSAVQAIHSSGANFVQVMLGTNDSRAAYLLPASAYQADMQALVNNLYADCPTLRVVICAAPPYVVPDAGGGSWLAGSDALLQQYGTALGSVHGIWLGSGLFSFFSGNPGLLSDGVHPTSDGNTALVAFWTSFDAPTLRTLASSGSAGPQITPAGGSVYPGGDLNLSVSGLPSGVTVSSWALVSAPAGLSVTSSGQVVYGSALASDTQVSVSARLSNANTLYGNFTARHSSPPGSGASSVPPVDFAPSFADAASAVLSAIQTYGLRFLGLIIAFAIFAWIIMQLRMRTRGA